MGALENPEDNLKHAEGNEPKYHKICTISGAKSLLLGKEN
jgi:hypothetical protein